MISYAQRRVEECEIMLERLREICPQLDLDGTRNVWIVKPGAKSRGRGKTEILVNVIVSKVIDKQVE